MRSRLIASVVITTFAAAALAWWAAPHLLHRHLIAKITSPDMAQRQRGLNYVIRRAAQRPHVLRDAVKQLKSADESNFLQIAAALQQGAVWTHPPIPADDWLRWIDILGRDRDVESRILAAQKLTDLAHLQSDPRMNDMLLRWLKDDDVDVRYNALIVTAELAAMTDGDDCKQLLEQSMKDSNAQIADEAALLLSIVQGSHEVQPIDLPPLDPDGVRRALRSAHADERDVACIVAADFDDAPDLVAQLMDDYDDIAKRSGAILAGLTGHHLDRLARKAGDEDIWAVRQIQRLGLWMAGKLPQFDPGALLARDDIPATTVILALLHHDRRRGLDALLTPRGDEMTFQLDGKQEPVDLTQLLTKHHWRYVLHRYLPATAPLHDVHALRNWWLIERRRPRDGKSARP